LLLHWGLGIAAGLSSVACAGCGTHFDDVASVAYLYASTSDAYRRAAWYAHADDSGRGHTNAAAHGNRYANGYVD
jgi:hypothetical protein